MWYEDKKWWKHAFDRAIRSLAQGVLVGIGECALMQEVNWMSSTSWHTLLRISTR